MSFRSFKDGFNKHFYEHIWYYLISILFLATGIILGLYCVKYMGATERDTLINYIGNLSSSSALSGLSSKDIFLGTIKNNILIILAFWVLGLTIVGAPLIMFLNIYKGFSLGFTFSFFIFGLKQRGVMLSLLGVLPQNIIYIPCIIMLSVFSLEYSLGIVKEKFNIGRVSKEESSIKIYTTMFLIITAIMTVGFFVEGFITPKLVRFALKGLGA